jgi:uncharacterized protein (DUF885 family)
MVNDYIPACRDTIAASDLPNGRAYYGLCVRSETTLDVTPKQVHEIGLAEVKCITKEMERVAARAGFADLESFRASLKTNPKHAPKSNEELLKYTALILITAQGHLPELFGRLPRMPVGLKEVPAYIAANHARAYYMQPAGDGTRAGFFFINTHDLSRHELYTLPALTLHEAIPGHHLQIALQQEREDVPNFRKYQSFTAYVEGWALYAESLGMEMGIYDDPYKDFGRLSMEMWRACRLVVDTGIHYFRWSRDRAIDYMAEHSALARSDITKEVDRYIVWPGQALSYKMGELKIKELRAKGERELGEKFDIRGFHDCILLSGALPLDMLEENVNTWIAAQRN